MEKTEAKSPRTIVYVTRDIERALGMMPNKYYRIITNRTPDSESVKEQFSEFITLIDPQNDPRTVATESLKIQDLLDTNQLLETSTMSKLMAEIGTDAAILVFKNTTLIESICKKNGWPLLNPSANLAEKIENKITQIEWLDELGKKYLPSHIVAPTKDLIWKKEPLIIQWAHGHTGDGTILVNSGEELAALQAKFPERPSRATSFVVGPSFTLNIVTTPNGVYTGNISYQITGLPPFTDNPFSTIGNDWSLPHTLLSENEILSIEDMAREIGTKMSQEGWCGMCGIDIIRDQERGQIFLIEINARQPASTTFESFLQQENRRNGVVGVTIFEAYITALLGDKIESPIVIINDGAQIIKRVTKDSKTLSTDEEVVGSLELAGYRTIQYSNTEYNSDQLRIQSMKGVMEAHGKFNARGKEIIDTL